jgi:hypothetical protein
MKRVSDQRWIRVACDDALVKQGYRCKYCKSRLSRSEATADHYRARARHGTNSKDNIVAACLRCNQAKGSMHGDHFLCLIKKDSAGTPYRIRVCSALRRIELESQRAQKRILALVGVPFEQSAA